MAAAPPSPATPQRRARSLMDGNMLAYARVVYAYNEALLRRDRASFDLITELRSIAVKDQKVVLLYYGSFSLTEGVSLLQLEVVDTWNLISAMIQEDERGHKDVLQDFSE